MKIGYNIPASEPTLAINSVSMSINGCCLFLRVSGLLGPDTCGVEGADMGWKHWKKPRSISR